ncbi:MAG: hypothetical protein IJW70_12040 [Clostridia bacterium]|nr:hypothetical protein [Clostridia bacterium]MBQ7380395.1 hypothetical protein [Clostridia bacterium]
MFCCDMMESNVYCADDQEKKPIFYSRRFDEYMLPDTDSSGILLRFCPWCGKKLPDSKRMRWFEELDALGIEISLLETEQVPPEYLSDAWWKK